MKRQKIKNNRSKNKVESTNNLTRENELTDRKFMVLVVKYDPAKEKESEKAVATMKKQITRLSGETQSVYQGSDEKIISALGKILNLTK